MKIKIKKKTLVRVEEGTTLEVTEQEAKRLIALKIAEPVETKTRKAK